MALDEGLVGANQSRWATPGRADRFMRAYLLLGRRLARCRSRSATASRPPTMLPKFLDITVAGTDQTQIFRR